jgi:GDP-4-dehydro-6-deoxy-D-mannose reductase
MKVFVTGASGFVGRKLVPRLEAAGHTTIGADREVDVTNPSSLHRALGQHRPDAIIHLAAVSSVAASWREPERCFHINFRGTRNLIHAAEELCPAARLLLIGSADEYATTTPQKSGFDESTPLRPRSPYARSKAAAELLGEAAAVRGQDVVRVRAFNHTGRGQSDQFVVSSFARQAAEIRRGVQEPVLRVGNLDSVRDFLHVDDVLEAYVALLDPAVPADVYNVASERAVAIREILQCMLELAEIDPVIERDDERWRPTDWSVGDASKLRSVTNWEPKVTLDALFRELYDDWLERVPPA